MRGRGLVLAAALLSAGSFALAQEVPAPAPLLATAKPWSALSAAQREALSPLRAQWSEFDPSSQEKWLKVAARYAKLAPDEQQRLQLRMAEWSRLSPAERLQARIGWRDAQRLSPAERQAKWEHYQSLSPEQRLALQERAATKRGAASAHAPLLVQAKPGVSSVPLTQQTLKPKTATGSQRPLRLEGLDPVTLLPRPPARAPSAP